MLKLTFNTAPLNLRSNQVFSTYIFKLKLINYLYNKEPLEWKKYAH